MSLADQLITHGWTKHTSWDRDTDKVCLNGALIAELGLLGKESQLTRDGEEGRTFRASCHILNKVVAQTWIQSDYVGYNDLPSTTFDDVLRVAKEFDEVVDWMKQMKGQAE